MGRGVGNGGVVSIFLIAVKKTEMFTAMKVRSHLQLILQVHLGEEAIVMGCGLLVICKRGKKLSI
jgi:hypothetical protein